MKKRIELRHRGFQRCCRRELHSGPQDRDIQNLCVFRDDLYIPEAVADEARAILLVPAPMQDIQIVLALVFVRFSVAAGGGEVQLAVLQLLRKVQMHTCAACTAADNLYNARQIDARIINPAGKRLWTDMLPDAVRRAELRAQLCFFRCCAAYGFPDCLFIRE